MFSVVEVLFLLLLAISAFTAAAPVSQSKGPMDPAYARHLAAFYARKPHTNAKRDYQWVCNSLSLTLTNIEVCANNLDLLRADDTCTADPNDGATGELCNSGDVFVTGVSYDGVKESVKCPWVADSVNFLITNCGTQGGSAVADHDGNFIVHVNDHWIT